jgi:predicted amidohydrolase
VLPFHTDANWPRPAPGAVLRQFTAGVAFLEGTPLDLLITCEGMALVGQDAASAESLTAGGHLLTAYTRAARNLGCTVVGSLLLREGDTVSNAQVCIGPEGAVLGCYRKTHLTPPERAAGLSPGPGAQLITTPAGTVAGVICFDLNYPNLRQVYRGLCPDVVAFSSLYHGGHAQQTWAFETGAYVAAACQDGFSEIRDPLGRVLSAATRYAGVAVARVGLERAVVHLDTGAEWFATVRRAHGSGVEISTAPDLGVALVTCRDPGLTIAHLRERHGLQTLAEYLARHE